MSATATTLKRWHDRAALLVLELGLTSSTVIDWLVAGLCYALASRLSRTTPFQQDVSEYVDDPAYRFPRRDPQTVPYELLTTLTFWMPLGLLAAISCARRSLLELHYSLLAFFAGYSLNWLFTDYVKVFVGELRPDFFDRCKWDKVLQACLGDPAIVQEGRRSFPSGHSSNAFFSCVFLALWIAGKNHGFHLGPSPSAIVTSSPVDSRLLRFLVAVSPIFLALYIALSRWEDHVHHPIDILAGSSLGVIVAMISYHIFFPQSFTSKDVSTAKPKGIDDLTERLDAYKKRQAAPIEDGERQPLLGP